MKKFIKSVKSFIRESVNCIAPYQIRNSHFKVMHHAWSYKEVIEWLKCYDAHEFGATHVLNFNGDLIAYKGA